MTTLEQAVTRVPIELWERILSYAVATGFSPSPEDGLIENLSVFSDNCTVVSAFTASKQAFDRLRRVCWSWNNSLLRIISDNDISLIAGYQFPWRQPGHQPGPNHWVQSPDRLCKARHIRLTTMFECLCDIPCYLSARWYRDMPIPQEGKQVDSPAPSLLAVSNLHGVRNDLNFTESMSLMPDLRILSLSYLRSTEGAISMRQLSEAYPHLTHLEVLSVERYTFDLGLELPLLTTLSLRPHRWSMVSSTFSHWGEPRIWNFPSLRYLFVHGNYSFSFITSHIEPLLRTTGSQLRGLTIVRDISRRSGPIGFQYPDEIWEWCPNLECIGGTGVSLVNMPVPPPTVPMRTVFLIAIFGHDRTKNSDHVNVRGTPDIITTIAKGWQNIECIQLRVTWDRFLLNFMHDKDRDRAEWVDLLIPFGLFRERDACPLRDADGIAFDDERACDVRQRIRVEAAALAQKLPATVWTNGSLAIRGLEGT